MSETAPPTPEPPRSSSSSPFTPPPPYIGREPDADARTMALIAHLLSIVTSFLGPLVIWMLKKDSSPFVEDQGGCVTVSAGVNCQRRVQSVAVAPF